MTEFRDRMITAVLAVVGAVAVALLMASILLMVKR